MKKNKIIFSILIIAFVVLGGFGAFHIAKQVAQNKTMPYREDTFVKLSEVNMHYRVYGNGKQSVILIHGNSATVNSLHSLAELLAKDYTVYVTESRCHGQSTDTQEITYKLMAKDIYEFAKALNIEKPYIIGHSDGGIVALTLASVYPDFPKAIISAGANSKPSMLKKGFIDSVKQNNKIKKSKLNDLMLNLPDFTDEDFAKIICPAYILAGENDIVELSDTIYIHESIKNSYVKIIENGTHNSYILENPSQTYNLAKEFFSNIKQ